MKWWSWWFGGEGEGESATFVHGGPVLRAGPRRLFLEAAARALFLEAAPRTLFLVAVEDGMAYETAEKTAYESVRVTLDLTELLDGASLVAVSAVTASAPAGGTAPTLSGTAVSGSRVQFRATGGTAGLYLVAVRFTTSVTDDLREAFCQISVT